MKMTSKDTRFYWKEIDATYNFCHGKRVAVLSMAQSITLSEVDVWNGFVYLLKSKCQMLN